MRTALIGTAVASLALGACSEGRAQSGGPVVQRSYQLAAFDKIEVAGPYDVRVVTGAQPAAQARGSERLLEQTVVAVENGTLKIHPRKQGWFGGFRWGGGKAQVDVRVPMLSEAAIAGSGKLGINRVQAGSFKGAVAGSGDMDVGDVAVGQLELEIAGSGNIHARGRAAEAKYEIAGSGGIEAAEVQAERVEAEIAGSGDIRAKASGTAKVDIAGSGNVEVTGGAKCTVDKAGSGNVRCS